MRSAHQGVPVENLPGVQSSDGLLSGLFGNSNNSTASAAPQPAYTNGMDAPIPPAPIQASNARPTASRGGGLDGWLLDNFFSRR